MDTPPIPCSTEPGVSNTLPECSNRPLRTRVGQLYGRYEKYSGLAIFILGFLWDALTLRRVDSLFDNAFLLGYLILIGLFIVLTLRRQNGAVLPQWLQKYERRFPWIMQFCFGGLFSSYVVFYFKSASFTRTLFFILLLVGLLIGNEFLEDRLQNRTLLAVLYSFCFYSFMAFFLPVILAIVKPWVFILAGVLSAAASLCVFALGLKTESVGWKRSVVPVAPWVLGVFLLLNVLYFASMIPPVPLALKFGHPYHHVKKVSADCYEARYAPPAFFRFWRQWDDPFLWSPGESVYCFTAIFAPNRVHDVRLFHVWSRKTDSGWKVTDRIQFAIATGGRDGGYRWYSRKSGVTPGKWRVEVQTENGQILGEIDFAVKRSHAPDPPLRTLLLR